MLDEQALSNVWAPRLLAVLRIITALLFLEHGLVKLFGFPPGAAPGAQPLLSFLGIAGLIEVVGAWLLLLGLFTRPVAFVLAGEMAVGYFLVHAPLGFYPAINAGEGAIRVPARRVRRWGFRKSGQHRCLLEVELTDAATK